MPDVTRFSVHFTKILFRYADEQCLRRHAEFFECVHTLQHYVGKRVEKFQKTFIFISSYETTAVVGLGEIKYGRNVK